MGVVNNRKVFYWISGILFALSIIALIFWGLNLGVDFKGGSVLEVKYTTPRPELAAITETLKPLNVSGLSLRQAGSDSYIIRAGEITEAEHQQILSTLGEKGDKIEEKLFNTIGPVLGREALIKSLWAIVFVLLAIVLYIAFAFRKVSEPVSSWKYGVIAVLALFHDVLIPTGIFAALGHIEGFEIDTLFITAILVVLGFSVHDTIVVFDRVRENLRLEYKGAKSDFAAIVGKSVSQTFVRSINTSVSTLLALVVLYFVGPDTTRMFSLVLIIGIFIGTYSSIFIASPLLVTLEKRQRESAK
jgi:preprotein translocase subunit SecF